MPGLFKKSFKLYLLHTSYLSITYCGTVSSLDRHAICLKFGGRFFTSLTMLGLKQKLVSAIQSKNHILITRSVSQKTPLVKEIINFAIQSLVFQSRLLNGAHSISDIKLPCYN